MSDYKVSIPSPEEAAEALARLRTGSPFNRNNRKTAILQGGIELKGSFEVYARDAKSGDVVWEHKADNIITDFGRRWWMDARFNVQQIGFTPSTEAPIAGRSTLSGDTTQIFASGNITPVNNSLTHTKTLSTTYGVPGVNRTLGTIFLMRTNDGVVAFSGPRSIVAYALLTPPKTQTTTQTLEVVYKISMTPIS